MILLDKNVFETLYYKYGQRLESYARKFLNDSHAAEDIIHDVFVSFWEKYQGKTSESWIPVLFTMVRNRCIDSLRHLTLKRSMSIPDIAMSKAEEALYNRFFSSENNADGDLLMDEMQEKIKAVIDTLPPRCREIFQMSRTGGLKNREIAAKLGISEKAVEKNITAALKAFRKKLD
ncbi:MAG: RNA polymerase sigma-70 factor [Bacteroidales bacterium]|nr:RNA polymerase sigma-70 factor [Bacteroidales bacterium]